VDAFVDLATVQRPAGRETCVRAAEDHRHGRSRSVPSGQATS